MNKKLKKLINTIDEKLKPNFTGIPKPGLTWEEVSSMNLDISLSKFPDKCPVCNKKLIEYKSDYQKIEGSGQFMVIGIYCPKGHFTFLECV